MSKFFAAFILLISLFAFQSSKAQGVSLSDFEVSNFNGSDIKIDWTIDNESGVSEYRIYRKTGGNSEQKYVGTIYANGSGKYTYYDKDVFKTEATTITYELRVIKNGSPSFFYASLTYTTTSVQRTWGSIKGMFKQ